MQAFYRVAEAWLWLAFARKESNPTELSSWPLYWNQNRTP